MFIHDEYHLGIYEIIFLLIFSRNLAVFLFKITEAIFSLVKKKSLTSSNF